MVKSNPNITYFSDNLFNREIFTKAEIRTMVTNLVKTINLLPLNVNNDSIKDKLLHFGIVNNDEEYNNLSVYLGKSLYTSLLKAFSKVDEDIVYNKYPDIAKYSKIYRKNTANEENNNDKPTMVDLFCGSGGLSLGLMQSGFKVIFANDIEKSALQTYSFNHPEIEGNKITMGGIEQIAHNISDYIPNNVDIIAGGPPCQGFSMANRQRLIDDPRNILYKYYVESVRELNPNIFIMENVKGMLSVASQVIEDFNNQTKVGYDIAYHVFNAKNFGVPQNRERLIYIGVRKDLTSKITARQIISNILSKYNTSNTVLSDAIQDLRPLKASHKKNSTNTDSIESGSIIELNNNLNPKNKKYLNKINNRENTIIYNHKARYNNDRDIEIYGRMLPGDKSDSPRIADIMPYKSRNDIFKDKYYKLIYSNICKTITAHMKFDCNMYIHPTQARGLTPREAARIQSYPDSFFFLGPYTKTYQQIGNSVPPLMARAIGEEVIKYI